MTINTDDLLNSILDSIARVTHVSPDNIPNIDLYMDQVTTLMDEELKSSKRYNEDKILTKTMINNYTKNNLLPASSKKKYSKEHVLVLIFIYYFKNILSIKDIETLLNPVTEQYFDTDKELDLSTIYREICKMEEDRIPALQDDITDLYNHSMESFKEVDEDQRGYLLLFSFICNLSFDVYIKKQIIEKLIDELPKPEKGKK